MLTSVAPSGYGPVRSYSTGNLGAQRPVQHPSMMNPNAVPFHDPHSLAAGYTYPNAVVNGSAEEICTIFVVGFPEDMQEREFQNMFVFCSGFEAAALKIPNYNPDEADVNGNISNSRRQIIGFAKFRSRAEALEARDILNGRKVDADRGSTLKAEMAKKNLHTKRGLSNDQSLSSGNSTISPTTIAARRPNQGLSSAYEAFHSVPTFLPDHLTPFQKIAYDYPNGTGKAAVDQYSLNADISGTQQSIGTHSWRLDASLSQLTGLVAAQRSLSLDNIDTVKSHNQQQLQLQQDQQQLEQQTEHSFSTAVSTGQQAAPISRLNSVKSLLDLPNVSTAGLAEAGNRLSSKSLTDLCSMTRSAPANEERGFRSALFGTISNHETTADEATCSLLRNSSNRPRRLGRLSINTVAAIGAQGGHTTQPASAGGVPAAFIQSPGIRSANPGDQNMPCNTLYVGNLPATAGEDELQMLFSKCRGYKRMCLKANCNGPMCFVEFEDVICASQALHELQGRLLSDTAKGGIRLSYSKNPLGVRQHVHPSPVSIPSSQMFIPAAPLSAPATVANGHPFLNSTASPDTTAVPASVASAYCGVFSEEPVTMGGYSSPWYDAGSSRHFNSPLANSVQLSQQQQDPQACPGSQPTHLSYPPITAAHADDGAYGDVCGCEPPEKSPPRPGSSVASSGSSVSASNHTAVSEGFRVPSALGAEVPSG